MELRDGDGRPKNISVFRTTAVALEVIVHITMALGTTTFQLRYPTIFFFSASKIVLRIVLILQKNCWQSDRGVPPRVLNASGYAGGSPTIGDLHHLVVFFLQIENAVIEPEMETITKYAFLEGPQTSHPATESDSHECFCHVACVCNLNLCIEHENLIGAVVDLFHLVYGLLANMFEAWVDWYAECVNPET
ncbi:hypothetical protein LTR70_005255 [Exophiala xenobiotica]|uniref:Uncharacterized protein n=1 Tax=Lithohypha guttulata TaxID=1690604 RepID=A0ABR0KAH6_9EURO|nr:hypothetical protein LTR24_004941 [Lithohypha guttulata]KAK5318820.1 hypothetical protein LTR70_005255 [Exophiala xenobiotica]